MGGLDVAFSPGYFEDGDYCIRLWKSGRRVVYLPEVAIIHFENASSDSHNYTHALYHKNHPYFVKMNADWLALQGPYGTPHLAMRGSHDDRFRVLYLPKSARGQAPQWKRVVQELQSRNCFVTVYPIHSDTTVERAENVSLPPDVELLPGGSLDTLSRFLDDRRHYYDGMLASDSEIRARLEQWLRQGEQT
jgi:hypothetical protein